MVSLVIGRSQSVDWKSTMEMQVHLHSMVLTNTF